MNIPSRTIQALLSLCARLERVHDIVLCFLDQGGLVCLLSRPTNHLFYGFENASSISVHHSLKDPHTLQQL